MKLKSIRNFITAAALTVLAVSSATAQQEVPQSEKITRHAQIAALASLKQYYTIPNFKIGGKYDLDKPESYAFGGEGGVTLESLGQEPLKVGYVTIGTPKRNENGEITNAVIINSFYSADATATYFFWVDGQPGVKSLGGGTPQVGPGRVIDTNKYFVVFLDALGLWGHSKPSAGLGLKFPHYNYFDMVQANYRLLKDHLKVAEVQLATGMSMGGSQTYAWGVMHSADGFVKAIMPIGGTVAAQGEDPLCEWVFTLASQAIMSDPVWQKTKGDYYKLPKSEHPNQGVMFSWSILAHSGLSWDLRAKQPWSTMKKEVFVWDAKDDTGAGQKGKAADFDAIDLLYRNSAEFPVNMTANLGRIKARTLVLHVENDQWLVVSRARATAAKVPGAGFATFRDPTAHYAVFKAQNVLKDIVAPFIANQWTAAAVSGGASAASGAGKPAGLSK